MTRILTPTGYRDVVSLNVGDEVSAFDAITGASIVNQIETIEWVDAAEWARWHTNAVLPPFTFYRINGRWTLNSEQSIWRNGDGVCHAKHLVVGDVIYDDADQPVTITSIAPLLDPPETFIKIVNLNGASFLLLPTEVITNSDDNQVEAQALQPGQYIVRDGGVFKIELIYTVKGWVRFDISGDHAYIADGLTLHNASRFWVGGTGTWDLATTTHWASSSNGAGGQTAPGSADTVTIDANSGAGTITPSFGGTGTFQSIACGAMGMTLDNRVNNNNVTLSASAGFNGSGTGTRSIFLGNGIYSLTATANFVSPWVMTTITNLTFEANLSTIDFTGVPPVLGRGQSFGSGALTYNALKVSGARLNSGLQITGVLTFNSINIAAPCVLSFSSNCTIGALAQSAQLVLVLSSSITLTFTNAPTIIGTAAALCSLISAEVASGTVDQITCTSGTFGGTWCAIYGLTFGGGATFVFNKSIDLGKNTGATINQPKYVSRSRVQSMAEAA